MLGSMKSRSNGQFSRDVAAELARLRTEVNTLRNLNDLLRGYISSLGEPHIAAITRIIRDAPEKTL
jgi:hypothetical protein